MPFAFPLQFLHVNNGSVELDASIMGVQQQEGKKIKVPLNSSSNHNELFMLCSPTLVGGLYMAFEGGPRGKANGVGLVLSGGGLSEERESVPEKGRSVSGLVDVGYEALENEGSLVKTTLEWVSLGLRDDNLGLCFTGEVVVMFSRALLVDGALLDEASKFPIVADNDPIDGNKVLLPSSLSLCLLLIDRALVEEATRFLAERLTEQDEGISKDVCKPLCMLSGEDVVVEGPKNQPKVTKIAILEESGEEGVLGFESPSRGSSK
ncbi:hypothetical protein CK203_027971 [Vitis vinifera]|uniref:Uncharacterized protein n=1 Tax=Vitis vinifera TaxID=29760 RepID=A0A438IM51_VITVI|nr:hypothetical protein CK203_027971 [Vitis vinifera]